MLGQMGVTVAENEGCPLNLVMPPLFILCVTNYVKEKNLYRQYEKCLILCVLISRNELLSAICLNNFSSPDTRSCAFLISTIASFASYLGSLLENSNALRRHDIFSHVQSLVYNVQINI